MKQLFLCWCCWLCCGYGITAYGQSQPTTAETLQWRDPMDAGFPLIQGQAWNEEDSGRYTRLPERLRTEARPDVWKLSEHSAGLSIHFRSNAAPIFIRYTLTHNDERAMNHMPATGVSGLDLYAIDQNGIETYVPRSIDWSNPDTIYCTFRPRPDEFFDHAGYEFHLYLPLYNGISDLAIGVDSSAQFKFLPCRSEKPIVAYGTSILQGACASRPGMAWTTILSRRLDWPLINLGFSGNGTMDSVIFAEMGKIDARLYMVDCLPNLTEKPDSLVAARLSQGVSLLRRHREVPILLIEHAEAELNGKDSAACHKNDLLRSCYKQLCQQGIPELYYLSCQEIGLAEDALVDGIHPSDYGMAQQAAACEAKIRKIFKESVGDLSTTRPLRQRRDAPYYEWTDRHKQILDQNRTDAPINIILGNSIVHFWGGFGDRSTWHGGTNWERFMVPAGFRNLGYGHDRIENVLWRVYHGELDGYNAQRIVIMIGTNNLALNTNEEIVQGIVYLANAVKQRQPQAQIEVIGLLPRRNQEERVARLNTQLSEAVVSSGFTFRNPGVRLLDRKGRIDESLFRDGLHLNEKGYDRIAPEIATGTTD